LIRELKFDLRIYVVVTSYDPLRIYLFNDGLVRFCTEKYSTSEAGLQNQFGHLTNYSVNMKNDAAFQPNDDREEEDGGLSSSKWSLQSFYKYVTEQGKVQELSTFKEALNDLIVKTFIAVESKILMQTPATGGAHSSGFELYGFDILLEGEEMKPWLLEVNVFPSLSSSSPMDKRIKTMLVSDLFQLVGLPFQDAGAVAEQVERDKNDRLLGITRKMKKMSSKTVEKPKRTRTVDELATCKAALLTELDAVDLHIVQALQEEDARRGHFERIFPTADSWQKYGGLFETHRYKNVLCMRWLETLQQHPVRRRSASASTHQRRRPAS
jgi:tubulin polyglutamylase TTLL4